MMVLCSGPGGPGLRPWYRSRSNSSAEPGESFMSIPCRFERSVLSYDEHGVILRSNHPEIYEAGLDELKALRQRLRGMREKESTLAHAKQREARGKGERRGQSLPGTAEHPLRRRQVFA